ncbi:hypothetical protein CEXT_790161 [Caerostris extrusa]|uniref:Uncharacterized protein n=1 Tax=Caerostris extrusa TaxID=172846 RepID=A0AAV4TI44_CAEEX|nr:hypothetical protein CEXT_790161 [Caerostris extrusa]
MTEQTIILEGSPRGRELNQYPNKLQGGPPQKEKRLQPRGLRLASWREKNTFLPRNLGVSAQRRDKGLVFVGMTWSTFRGAPGQIGTYGTLVTCSHSFRDTFRE